MSQDRFATSFGANTSAYETGRPSYPSEAVEWVLDGLARPIDAVDVGAGTGKFTRALVAAGCRTTAVDPDEQMLAALAETTPDVPVLVGTAEHQPLPDDSADLVTMAQSWHWVDQESAAVEIARVLRPGGRLALIWNIRDESDAWVARLSGAMGSTKAGRMLVDADQVLAGFGAFEEFTYRWTREMTSEQLEQMVRSRSYYLASDDEAKARVDAGLAEVLAERPELAAGGTVALPYVTHAFRAALK